MSKGGRRPGAGRPKKMQSEIMQINLDLASSIYHDWLLDKTVDKAEKIKHIVPLLVKKMPEKFEGEVKMNVMPLIRIDGKEVHYDVGS